jgi:protein TonB
VQRLTYGQGAGRQPAPSYPPDAAADRQQGTVMVRFEVDNTGRVIAAFAAAPSPWPLLNEAAVQAVRYTWRFPPGPARIYDVSIEFKLREL